MPFKLNNIIDKIDISLLRDAIIVIDSRGRIIFWNEATSRMLVYTAEETLGMDVYKLIAPKQYKNKYKQIFGDFRATGKNTRSNNTIELLAVRKDQIEIAVELSLSSVVIGNKWYIVCLLRDISARTQVEQDLRRANEQLETKVTELMGKLYAINRKLAAVNEEALAVNQKLNWATREKEQEIDVRHQVEHELLVKTEKMECFFSLMQDLLCFIDKQGNFCK